MDAAIAGLIGAAIGAVAGMTGTLITPTYKQNKSIQNGYVISV